MQLLGELFRRGTQHITLRQQLPELFKGEKNAKNLTEVIFFKAKSVSIYKTRNAFCIGELYITLCVIPMCININHEFPKICKSSPLFYTKYYEQRYAKGWNINMSLNPTANVGKE